MFVIVKCAYPVITRRVDPMLVYCLRRWPNNKPTSRQHLLFTGSYIPACVVRLFFLRTGRSRIFILWACVCIVIQTRDFRSPVFKGMSKLPRRQCGLGSISCRQELCRAKSKGSNCLLCKWAATAFWLCTSELCKSLMWKLLWVFEQWGITLICGTWLCQKLHVLRAPHSAWRPSYNE